MTEKREKPKVTPAGVAAFPHIYEKDKGPRDQPTPEDRRKYKITLVFDKGGEVEEFAQFVRSQHEELEGSPKNCPVKDGDKRVRKDKETGKKTPDEAFKGKWLVQFTSKWQPGLVDSRKAQLREPVKIMPGDLVKVAYTPAPIDEGSVTGYYLRLCAVQLIEKRNLGGGASAAGIDAFDEEEDGYVVPEGLGAVEMTSASTSGDF